MPNGDQRDREEFALLRDKVLLVVGVVGILGIAFAAVITDVKNPEVALAALTIFGGLLGAPTVLRLDEKRGKKSDRDDFQPPTQ